MKDAGDIAGWIMTGGGAVLIVVCLWMAISGSQTSSDSDHSALSSPDYTSPAPLPSSNTGYPAIPSTSDIPPYSTQSESAEPAPQAPTGTSGSGSSDAIAPRDAYEEGFEDGFEQGEYDRSRGLSFGADYDDSNDYSGRHEAMYCEGYEDGYHDGFASYTPSDYDDDPEEW